ncbi:MAG: ABC transporter substrate-binding protein [Mariprofundaceae bacterium]
MTSALLFLTACTPAPAPELKLGTNVWPGYEPLYLARDLGLLKGSGVKLIEYPSATEVLRGMRDGNIDAAALTLDEALSLVQDGIRLRVVLVMDTSHGADAVVAQAGVETVADLRGRRLGAETTALGAYMVSRMLELGGLSRTDVTIVPLTLNEHEQAFRQGEVDAVVSFEPVVSRLKAAGGHIVFDSRRIPGEVVDVLVIRESVLNGQRQTMRHLLRQWFAALDYRPTRPDDAAERMRGRPGLTAEETLNQYRGLKLPDVEQNRKLLAGDEPLLAHTARMLAESMRKAGLLRKPVSLDGLLSPVCLPEEGQRTLRHVRGLACPPWAGCRCAGCCRCWCCLWLRFWPRLTGWSRATVCYGPSKRAGESISRKICTARPYIWNMRCATGTCRPCASR